MCPAIALPRHRMWRFGVRRSSDVTRGRARKSYVSRSYACRRSVCRSAVIASLIIAAAAVLRSFALPPTVCHAGRFSVCQCIAGGAVRRATSAVMRFCRGGGCGGCSMSDSPVGGEPARQRSCHLSAGEYDMSHMCTRAAASAAKKATLTCNTKECNTKYTTLIYIYSY